MDVDGEAEVREKEMTGLEFADSMREPEREIASQARAALDDSCTIELEPANNAVAVGVEENRSSYIPDIVVTDAISGRSILIEVNQSISSAFAAKMSRFRAIHRAVEGQGNQFLLVMIGAGSDDPWFLDELRRLNIDFVVATRPGAVADEVASLLDKLRSGALLHAKASVGPDAPR